MTERIILPTGVRPVHYDLSLTPNFTNFTFDGTVHAHLKVSESSNQITLNTRDVKVDHANTYIQLADGKRISATGVSYGAHDFTTIALESAFPVEDLILVVNFLGNLNDTMAGFYRSSYTVGNEKRWMGVTQFEADDARRAFPCWDEPAIKATFDVTLIVPKVLTALSNMPVKHEAESGELKSVRFDTTPIMSTYLLAFAVGEFDSLESRTQHGVSVRVFTPPGKGSEGEFALDVATRTLDFFDDYFAVPYPLPKLDLIAVPDFAAGAMENWGLVTFRSLLLLFNPETTSSSIKQSIGYVIGHELAHQWFGNLVTMEWWDDLWLNEAFATWVGWRAMDHLFPEWKVWDQFIRGEFARGMDLDSLKSSHPIEVPMKCSEDVKEIFDAISYSKGASILRMLVATLGETAFQTGLRAYIDKFKYSNTRTADLWNALSAASGQDVFGLMNSWTKQTGYPVVALSCKGGCLCAHQSKYLRSGPEPEDKTRWVIPLRISSSEPGGVSNEYAVGEVTELKEKVPTGPDAWLKANHQQAGFFRVQYTAELLELVGNSIRHVSTSDRTGIVDDAFSLSSAGYMQTTAALQLLKYFKDESEYVVWSMIVDQLRRLRSVWSEQQADVREALSALCLSLVRERARNLGWEASPNESHLTGLLRTVLVTEAGSLGDERIVQEAKECVVKKH
eukprot:c8778_g1_i1.p1 GENE.c8778_g1_i1~~c8778_g1_i1.p1  ORF type:complete len:694 (-),score=157.71 c8778_g1_i1:127-2160(-)